MKTKTRKVRSVKNPTHIRANNVRIGYPVDHRCYEAAASNFLESQGWIELEDGWNQNIRCSGFDNRGRQITMTVPTDSYPIEKAVKIASAHVRGDW